MLDSDQETSNNLSINLLLLPRILKLMKDMVNDSTPLLTPRLRVPNKVPRNVSKIILTHLKIMNKIYRYTRDHFKEFT